jgi:hypothetical protein
MDDDLDFRNKVHSEADVCGELAKVADGLHVDLLLFDLEAGLFLNGSRHILGGDGTVKFAGLTSLGGKNNGNAVDLIGKRFEL